MRCNVQYRHSTGVMLGRIAVAVARLQAVNYLVSSKTQSNDLARNIASVKLTNIEFNFLIIFHITINILILKNHGEASRSENN